MFYCKDDGTLYTQPERAKAYLDLRTAKGILAGLKASKMELGACKEVIQKFLGDKPWAAEIIREIFLTERERYSYYRSEHQRRYNEWHRQNEQNKRSSWEESIRAARYSILGDAMKFFGFGDEMPDHATIKKTYLMLCMKHHPDKGGNTATFQMLQDYKDAIYTAARMS